MRNIVFFDIDGTLVSDDGAHTFPESAKSAVAAARENGHLMYINTGRTIVNIERELIDVGFDGFVCGCGTYVKCGDEVLLNYTIEKKLCADTARLIRECDIMPLYERYDTFFLDEFARENERLRGLREWHRRNNIASSPYIDFDTFSFDKFVAWYDEKSDIERFRRELDDSLDYIDRGAGFCEIVPKKYSKGTGVDMVLRHEKISRENSYAIGDSMNDLPMLEAVGHSIAMGNGGVLHNCVSFVTKDVLGGGVKYALEHFGMI